MNKESKFLKEFLGGMVSKIIVCLMVLLLGITLEVASSPMAYAASAVQPQYNAVAQTQKSDYAPNEEIVVEYSDFPGNSYEWITVVPVSNADNNYDQWFYTKGNQSGSLTFKGLAAGDYEVRSYFTRSASDVKTRSRFTITEPEYNSVAQTQKGNYVPNEMIVVEYSDLPGNSYEWITVVPASNADNKYEQWFYTKGNHQGSLTFKPLEPGDYEVRSYFTRSAVDVKTRSSFTVKEPEYKPVVQTAPNEEITDNSSSQAIGPKPEVCDPNKPIPGAFSAIRIGDIDGFGFSDGKNLTAANGKSVNIDGNGVLTTGDYLPDFNGDAKFSNRDGGDPFDNRSYAEADATFLTGDGYQDMGSTGSDYTDVFLGKAFTKLKSDRPFPDGDAKTLPNQPGFKFRFKVAKDKLPEGTPLFLNTMLGDYDVKPTQVILKTVNGKSITKELKVSEKGKTDGSIQASYVALKFNQVFRDGDAKGEPGYWVGSFDVDFDAPKEPATSFDFAEIGTNKILLKPCPPKAYQGEIHGLNWNDTDGDGDRSTIISGNPPDVMFVIDLSGSTDGRFQGSDMGDVNGDGRSNTILDGEISGFIALNQQLIDLGFGDTGKVSLIGFAERTGQIDMDLATPGFQLAIAPGVDKNGNGIPDVKDVLSSLTRDSNFYGRGTNYEPGLKLAIATLSSLNTPAGKANVVFLSDGVPGGGESGRSYATKQINYIDEADSLHSANVNVTAFGAGSGAELPPLQKVDSRAAIFTTTDELVDVFSGLKGIGSSSSSSGLEPALPNVTIYLDLNDNGKLDGKEPSQVTNDKGLYQFTDLAPGTYIVRQVLQSGFTQTAPAGGFAKVTLGEDEIVSDINFGNTNN